MIQADILFIKDDNFYKQVNKNGDQITGYELFFQLVNDFKNKYNEFIHSFGESDKLIQFIFKSDYIINLRRQDNSRYIELYSHKDSLEDFTEKFEYIRNIITEMNIK